ncbi:hypothetical protein [Humibacter ginsenosidimutans]|uniref:Uncharacterized protein n=1 Tax=Humibacter ginsenosidimutans TaxID=2599293 RepID=A0A5B8M6P9_9MICO|nr:hypothetical protein [Humibacter ginsenosidimutans]QDZ15799.1 hypothetical protein FPZ11_14420 [Humibacter ginsenosidimutans]
MSETVKAIVYLQVQPEISGYSWERDTIASVKGAKVVGSTQNRSQRPKPGTVEVKLTVEIPKSAFLPLRPEAIVVVPESLTAPHPIEVEAEDANEGDS